MHKLLIGLAGIIAFAATEVVKGDLITTIPANTAVGSATTNAGTGLAGSVYNCNPINTALFAGGGGPDTTDGLSSVQTYMAANSASGNYTATSLIYSGSDSSPTNTFLGSDSNGTAATDTTHLNTSIFDAKGFVNIPSAGTYNFGVTNSDDGSFILISGQTVTADGGSHGGQSANGSVTFSAAGQYPIEIMYINQQYQGTSTTDGGGGATFTYITPSGTTLYTTVQTPEPGSVGMISIVVLGLLCRRKSC